MAQDTNKEKVIFFAKASLSNVISEEDIAEVKASVSTLEQQKDLMKMISIMLSTGMNRNDDVFLKEEVLPSRSTGAHKPLNIEHDESVIIGHILRTYVTLKDGTKVPDNQTPEQSDFDITAESVIYKYLLPKVAEDIRTKAEAGQLFVSVEAWFSDYDYLVGKKIIKRNEDTAGVLDSVLRAKGGDGVYKGQKVGRVLRNILLGGMGVVKTPANPESVIKSISKVEASDVFIDDVIIKSNIIGDLVMGKTIAAEEKKDAVVEQKPAVEQKTGAKEEVKVDTKVEVKEEVKVEAKTEVVAAPAVAPQPVVPNEVTAIIEAAKKDFDAKLLAKDAEAKTAKATYEAAIEIQSAASKKVSEDLQIKLDSANKEIEALKVENSKLVASLKSINDKIEADKIQEAINARKSIIEKELSISGDLLNKIWIESSSKSQEDFDKYLKDLKALVSYSKEETKDAKETKTEAKVAVEEKQVPSVEEMKKIDTPIPIVTEVNKQKTQNEVARDVLTKFLVHSKTFKKLCNK